MLLTIQELVSYVIPLLYRELRFQIWGYNIKPGVERPVLNDCLKMGTKEHKAYI